MSIQAERQKYLQKNYELVSLDHTPPEKKSDICYKQRLCDSMEESMQNNTICEKNSKNISKYVGYS